MQEIRLVADISSSLGTVDANVIRLHEGVDYIHKLVLIMSSTQKE